MYFLKYAYLCYLGGSGLIFVFYGGVKLVAGAGFEPTTFGL